MYGRTFEQISKTYRPQEFSRAWGGIKHCVNHRRFKLTSFKLLQTHFTSIKTSKTDQAQLFLCSGKLIVSFSKKFGSIKSNQSFDLPSNIDIEILADEPAEFFVFSKNKIKENKKFTSTKTNNSGGILGGISNGMPITLRIAFKPASSISKIQNSVDIKKKKSIKLQVGGRHDPCVVPRAPPVVDSLIALTIADHALLSGFIKPTL